jgi:hypothetical protein
MTRTFHLWPEEPDQRDTRIEVSAVLEEVRGKQKQLFFRLPIEESPNLTPAADPFVLAIAFHVMAADADLEVHGGVSPSLLRGLEEFQAAWCRWRPERYSPFAVKAEVEREEARATEDRALMTFSGGLDSCCTVWRHTTGDLGRRKQRLGAAVMVHGFDIPLDQAEVFTRAAANSTAILDTIDVPLIPVACNIRVLRDDWEDSHGAALAACLHLFAGGYRTGLIASSGVYESIRIPWGSNPVTDPLLSSDSFSIVHDGCDLTRWEKADVIADWDAAQQLVRVCWDGEHLDRNCGVCMRCVGTAVCYAAVGRQIPTSIPVPSPAEAVERLRALKPNLVQLGLFENMAGTARRKGLKDPWIADLERFVESQRNVKKKRRFGFPGEA